jgi:exonuclease SbcC
VIIHSLRVSGYQIIGDPIQLFFPESGRIGIFGANESGKSTLMEAVEFALYGLRKGRGAIEEAKENIVTWGKDEAKVEVEFSSGRDRYKLSRSLSSRGHHARLVSVAGGVGNTQTYLTSLTEIESQIEHITGMDRESFTKLVYIKQKDLDALKDLKAKREQLVDKVMGIEIFDNAAKLVKDDTSNLEDEILKQDAELGPIRENAKLYAGTLEQKEVFRNQIGDVERRLDEKTKELDSAKSISDGYNWLFAFNAKTNLIASKTSERNRIRLDIDRIGRLTQDNTTYGDAVTALKPQATRLTPIREELLRLESTLGQHTTMLSRLGVARAEAVKKHNLTDAEQTLSGDLQKRKDSQLLQFMGMLVVSVVLVVAGVLTALVLILLGIITGAMTAALYVRYRRTDRLIAGTMDIQSINKQIDDTKGSMQDIQRQIAQIASNTHLKTRSEVDQALSKINEQVMHMTGQTSIDGVEALILNNAREIKTLQASNPEAKLQTLDGEIIEEGKAVQEMEKAKPASASQLQYAATAHTSAQERTETLQRERADIEKEHQNLLGRISQLDTVLSNTKSDHDRLPSLETHYQALTDKKTLLRLVLDELGETSKKLRSQVLPQARLIVNQILPIMTDGRYSELEITEDLKFKAHSIEAGGYKEREIFSGGTQDQFLIALRLAFTQSILDSRVMADRYCLLMDECISSSDDQRKQGIFEVLDAVKKTFSQIFVIAHEDISNVTDHHLILSRNRRGYTEVRSKSW